MKNVRVGIDVGGTFTHAVAIDNETLEVLEHAVHPTSHSAAEGVAKGIVEVFKALQSKLPEHKVVFLAHSTTQATNAMLEGDVVPVGILGLGSQMDLKAKSDMEVGAIELAPGKHLPTKLSYLTSEANLEAELQKLKDEGMGAIVAAQPFSVDDPSGEKRILEMAAKLEIPACATHEMSGLYGLRVRTRTAVLNASILPKMIETALMTEKSLRSLDVQAALMIMRSDGGVMSLEEVRRRPVMTLLSGPAAGIAAALVFLRASDALFLEVGGTSTDICLVKDGRAALRSASLGGHPTYLKTLDSRTLGIAGGSMVRREGGKLDVGPRSAHVAGCRYASFVTPEEVDACEVKEVQPLKSDPPYLVLEGPAGRIAVTTTCAANYLGFVPANGYSQGNRAAIEKALFKLGDKLGREPEELAREILDQAAAKVIPTVKQLIADYKMGDRALKLIGGGGGAAAIVPYVAQKLGMPHEIAPRAEVISAIGAALAMVKETIEKNILNPSQADLAAIRAEAEKAVLKMGADPDTITVTVEVDSQRNVVRATATGSVEFVAQNLLEQQVDEGSRLQTLKEASPKEESYELLGQTDSFFVYESLRIQKALFNLLKSKKKTLWVTDGRGNVKLQVPGGKVVGTPGPELFLNLEKVLNQHTSYGDAGAQIPALHVLSGRKLVDLTALQTAEQVVSLARQELGESAQVEESAFFLVHPR